MGAIDEKFSKYVTNAQKDFVSKKSVQGSRAYETNYEYDNENNYISSRMATAKFKTDV